MEPRAGARAELVRRGRQARTGRATASATGGASSPSATTWIATLPIGYGDGIRRALTQQLRRARRRAALSARRDGEHGQHHARPGRRRRGVDVGQPATIIGVDGGERQTAEELARRIGTINYEIVCGDLAARAAGLPPRRGAGVSDCSRSARGAGATRASGRGSSAARSATGCSGARRRLTTSRSTGEPARVARTLARRAGGHPFELSEGFGVWRVVARDRAGRSTCCRSRAARSRPTWRRAT